MEVIMNIRAGLGSIKLYLYMKKRGVKPEVFHDFQNLFQTDISLSKMACLLENMEMDTDCYKEKPVIKQRIERIFQLCDSNPIAFTLFELALLEYADSSLDVLLGMLFLGHKRGIRLLEAAQIIYPTEEYFDYISEIVRCKEILSLFLLKEPESFDPLFSHYQVDTWLVAFLSGVDYVPELLKNIIEIFSKTSVLEPLLLYKDIFCRMMCLIQEKSKEQKDCLILVLCGEAYIGKRFLVRHCAKNCQRDLVMVDFNLFMEGSEEELRLKKEALIREVVLLQAMLGICHVSRKKKDVFYQFVIFIQELSERIDTIFILSEEQIYLDLVLKQPIYHIDLEKGNDRDYQEIWKYFLQLYLPDFPFYISVAELADKITLPVGVIKKIIRKIALTPEQYMELSDVLHLCNRFFETEPESGIRKMMTPYQMDTIKLDLHTKMILQDICNQIKNQTQVFDRWNMRQLYPYGRCVSVLFTGPPGTGKTMAASVIANMVNLDLYRVDLSQLMDKYIGETEKKLERIFLQAEKSHGILFFDEADAIFGKRSELNDSKDRFANTQIAYLLQKMEEYDGTVILASNYRENIDKAFIRRINFIVEFTYPDIGIRYEIWKSLFTESMEYEEIDFEFLARKFELSGAMIKNIVLKAAFFAASKQEPIRMQAILAALIQEYSKLGKKIQKEELEEYAF